MDPNVLSDQGDQRDPLVEKALALLSGKPSRSDEAGKRAAFLERKPKPETKREAKLKLPLDQDRQCWAAGALVRVTSMNGQTVCGLVMIHRVEVAPLRPGYWYWVWTEVGDTWVHESLVKGA